MSPVNSPININESDLVPATSVHFLQIPPFLISLCVRPKSLVCTLRLSLLCFKSNLCRCSHHPRSHTTRTRWPGMRLSPQSPDLC